MVNINQQNLNKTDGTKKVVLVGGCFDLLHYGHIQFLTQAKNQGTYLLVALESDENVRHSKGETRPIHTQAQRRKMLEALSCVDEVLNLPLMTRDQDYINLVLTVHPQVIAVTQGDPITDKKRLQAQSIGADFVVIPKIHTPSTSQLAKLLGLE
jgi:FAD synthetase